VPAGRSTAQRIGFYAGPVLALIACLSLPDTYTGPAGDSVSFSTAGHLTAAMAVWMATWWMTEAVDIEVTALLPVACFPLSGAATLAATLQPYASDVIFLFMGSFMLGAAIEHCGLDRKLAIATLRMAGNSPARIIGGFMLATAMLSMWISNTACAAMMVPIALSVVDDMLRRRTGRGLADGGIAQECVPERHFASALLLGVAYAASIGGTATIVGSPPNGIAARFLEQTYGRQVGFAEWIMLGGTFTVVFLPLCWLMLTRWLFPANVDAPWAKEPAPARLESEPLTRAQRTVLAVFFITALLWIFGPLLRELSIGGVRPLARLTDTVTAMLAALALFSLPVDRQGTRALTWKRASNIPWGVLILFGGGLTLAAAVEANGVSHWIGALTRHWNVLPPLLMLLAIVTLIVFLSEVTSNTAQVATMLPVLAAMAPGLGLNPYLLVVACTLGASSAYMMPVGTPPNAIVFGTGLVTMPQMMRAGIALNLAGIVVITLICWLLVPPILGMP
jgi:sodium-dependent dicarboxylate transporter 2/3/5